MDSRSTDLFGALILILVGVGVNMVLIIHGTYRKLYNRFMNWKDGCVCGSAGDHHSVECYTGQPQG